MTDPDDAPAIDDLDDEQRQALQAEVDLIAAEAHDRTGH